MASNKTSMAEHLSKCHGDRFICRAQGCMFAGSRGDVDSHLKEVHKYLGCPEAACDFVSRHEGALSRHYRKAHAKRLRDAMCRASNCSFTGSKDGVKLHLKEVHKYLECPEAGCDYMGPNKIALHQHQKGIHGKKMHCPVAGCDWDGTRRTYNQHHKHSHGPTYKCPEPNCPVTHTAVLLRKHVRSAHARPKFTLEMVRKCEVVRQAKDDEGLEGSVIDDADEDEDDDYDDEDDGDYDDSVR
ncbi:hypothetical protein B0T13DRAFT_395641 [Neurospora crassa]|nr:hypothetical protein B0T13DRAFT_395641 [Neurospora crassa]